MVVWNTVIGTFQRVPVKGYAKFVPQRNQTMRVKLWLRDNQT